mmetsp:Transcript_9204/g.19843  ORF Transcript_9204/g.19843 Transcript_9204/m.19843 type:complete len:229 (+) Transcript_9204:298-984(+)
MSADGTTTANATRHSSVPTTAPIATRSDNTGTIVLTAWRRAGNIAKVTAEDRDSAIYPKLSPPIQPCAPPHRTTRAIASVCWVGRVRWRRIRVPIRTTANATLTPTCAMLARTATIAIPACNCDFKDAKLARPPAAFGAERKPCAFRRREASTPDISPPRPTPARRKILCQRVQRPKAIPFHSRLPWPNRPTGSTISLMSNPCGPEESWAPVSTFESMTMVSTPIIPT